MKEESGKSMEKQQIKEALNKNESRHIVRFFMLLIVFFLGLLFLLQWETLGYSDYRLTILGGVAFLAGSVCLFFHSEREFELLNHLGHGLLLSGILLLISGSFGSFSDWLVYWEWWISISLIACSFLYGFSLKPRKSPMALKITRYAILLGLLLLAFFPYLLQSVTTGELALSRGATRLLQIIPLGLFAFILWDLLRHRRQMDRRLCSLLLLSLSIFTLSNLVMMMSERSVDGYFLLAALFFFLAEIVLVSAIGEWVNLEFFHLRQTSKNAEEKLQTACNQISQLEAQIDILHQFMDEVPDLLFIKDRSGKFLYNNRAHLELLGMQNQIEALGKSDFDVFSFDRARQYYLEEQKVIQGILPELSIQSHTPSNKTGGKNVWLSETKVPMRNEHGEIIGLYCCSQDISERKNAEDALRESEERYRRLIESAPIPFLMVCQNEVVMVNNEAVAVLGGRSKEDIIQTPIHHFAPEIDLQRLDDQINFKAKSTKNTQPIELKVTRLDGYQIDVELMASKAEFFGMPAVQILFWDVTEQRKAEKGLRLSKDRLRLALESANQGLWDWNLLTNEMYFDETWAMIMGYREAAELQPVMSTWEKSIYPEDKKQVFRNLNDHLTGLRPNFTAEYRAYRSNSEVIWVQAKGRVVEWSVDGNPSRIMGTLQDINARKEVERDLQEARKAAEDAAKTKAEFLASMSHEIRTPMNAVIGMTSLLLDTELQAQQRDYVNTIRVSGDSLLSIINDILDFSKIEEGKLDLERQPFYLYDCVESAIDLVASKAQEKGLEVMYNLQGQVPIAIEGDVTRLRQILVNLLSNAVKFTDQGEVEVLVTSQTINEDWHQIQFSVRDTGIGIPREQQDRLFKSFTQIDASTTRKYGGTGLGLAISKRLAEIMGGTMWVESDEGTGSVFHFTVRTREIIFNIPQICRKDQPEFAGKRVLLVDDNFNHLNIIAEHLRGWNMEVDAFTSCDQADQQFRQAKKPYDLLMVDRQMPGQVSLEWVDRLWKEGYLPGGAILISALGDKPSHLEKPSVFAEISKPLKLQIFHDTLQSFFKHEHRSGSAQGEKSQGFDQKFGEKYPMRILLAEDNLTNQKVAVAILAKLGYRVDLAANGIEAMQAVERQKYDVVLMDVQMPEMDGIEATQRIRSEVASSHQPGRIIALTANALEGDRERLIESGMDDYVSKPIAVENLKEALKNAYENLFGRPDVVNVVLGGFQAINHAQLHELIEQIGGDNGGGSARELLDIFTSEAREGIIGLAEAVEEKDYVRCKHYAHNLKSTSAYIGAENLSKLLAKIETATSHGRNEEIPGLYAAARDEFSRVLVELERVRQLAGCVD